MDISPQEARLHQLLDQLENLRWEFGEELDCAYDILTVATDSIIAIIAGWHGN